MVRLRLISLGLAAIIFSGLLYLAGTQQFDLITDLISNERTVVAEVEEEEKEPPPPPPPPPPRERPNVPPPPTQFAPPVDAPPAFTELPVSPEPPPPAPPTPPAPPAPPPAPSVITNATFTQRPNARDFERYYPERALEREREGVVVLNCVVNASGGLRCSVASEDPAGWGFGNASLEISRFFRVAPQTRDGVPTDGGTIRIPIRWQLGE